MAKDYGTEYLAAFVVGALIGAGAALLLAPHPPTRRERILKELKPYRKKMRKHAGKLRKQTGEQAAVVGQWSEELARASRVVLDDLREEVAGIVANARNQVADAVEEQLDSAHDTLRRGTRRIRT